MKIKCDVIRDLLPLYRDNICSEESEKIVLEHLSSCENCRKELEKIDEELLGGNNMNDIKQIENVSQVWKRDKKSAFFAGTFIVSFLAFLGTIIAFNVIGSYVAEDGTLVEPFALIPLGFFCLLIAIISGIVFAIMKVSRLVKRGKNK